MGNLYKTVNVFREPVLKEDESHLKAGFVKTVLYAVALLTAFIVIAVYLYQDERTFVINIKPVTYSEYRAVSDKGPTCGCSKSLIQVTTMPAAGPPASYPPPAPGERHTRPQQLHLEHGGRPVQPQRQHHGHVPLRGRGPL